MKHLMRVVTLLVLVAMLAAPVAAQDREKKKLKRGQKQRGVAVAMMQKLKKIDLTDEQKVKIKKIVATYAPKLKRIAAGLKPAPGQREAVMAARKKAIEEGKKGKELRDAVTAAMNLTDEQKEMRKKQQAMQGGMRKEVLAVLTPEQAKIVRAAGKRKVDPNKAKKKRGTKRRNDK